MILLTAMLADTGYVFEITRSGESLCLTDVEIVAIGALAGLGVEKPAPFLEQAMELGSVEISEVER